VLPVAIPGIVTGIVLTAGRVFGEAAALLFTAGVATPSNYNFSFFSLTDPRSPWSLFRPAETLSVYIWNIRSEGLMPPDVLRAVADMSSMVLIVAVLLFNVGSRRLGRLLQRRISGL